MDQVLAELQAALPERYTLEREIARTAMSRVYLARERHPDRAVVVKVLDNSLTVHLGQERFLREIDLTSGLSHPHIVPIFSAGDAAEALYYVMPFIEGETLRERLEREGRFSVEQSVRIAQEIARALQYAHGKGIIHRDIKPSNILFHEGHALVADFGIARVLSLADQGSLTQTGHAIGTPDYMSPEQVSPQEDLDARTDMYSLACLLFEMLVGEPPFRSATSRATLARHLAEEPGSIRSRRRNVHREIDGVVQRALQKAPEDRFQSIEEFGFALADAAHMASAEAASGRFSSSHALQGWGPAAPRWAQTTIAVLLVVAAAGVAWRAWGGTGLAPAAGLYTYVDSVAVMPFANLTGDPEYDRLTAGLADEISHLLAQVSELKVTSSYSVGSLEPGVDRGEGIMAELGVRHLLEGSLDVESDQVRVQTWHGDEEDLDLGISDYSGSVTNWFPAESRIAREIVEDLLTTMGISTEGILGSGGGVGRRSRIFGDRWLATRTADGVREAIAAYEESIALDSTYAEAYAGLSRAYALAVTYRYNVGMGAYQAAGRSLAYADEAIRLDSTLADGYAARGYIETLTLAPLSQAEADFDKAGEIQPNNPNIPSWSSRLAARRGDYGAALSAARRAVRLDPTHSGRKLAFGLRAVQAGLYEEALAETEEVIALDPSLMLTRAIQGRALLLAGRTADCINTPLGPHEVIRAMCLYEEGDELAASAIVDSVSSVVEREESGHDLTHVARAEDLATYYAWIGDVSQARDWMLRAYLMSPTGIDPNVLESALFNRVRDDDLFRFSLGGSLGLVWPLVEEARDSAETF